MDFVALLLNHRNCFTKCFLVDSKPSIIHVAALTFNEKVMVTVLICANEELNKVSPRELSKLHFARASQKTVPQDLPPERWS